VTIAMLSWARVGSGKLSALSSPFMGFGPPLSSSPLPSPPILRSLIIYPFVFAREIGLSSGLFRHAGVSNLPFACLDATPPSSLAVPDCIFWDSGEGRSMGRGGSWGHRTDRVVFDHAHGQGCPRAGEGVEEARHGHGKEAHIDNA
jgi:hypothetical protein